MEQEVTDKPMLIENLGKIYRTENSKYKTHCGIFRCPLCGNEFMSLIYDVTRGHTKSCGCYSKTLLGNSTKTHGLSKHPLYKTWHDMTQRCNNTEHKAYPYYGARGITVAARWLEVSNFISDMYDSYTEGLSLDRIDNNLGYSKDNCRWATKTTQTRNTRRIHKHNTSGYRGVSFYKSANKFSAEITVNNKKIRLGMYTLALDAAKAYDTYVAENNLEHTINGVLNNEN